MTKLLWTPRLHFHFRLVIPAAAEGKRATVNLVPVDECTYCESEWLNQRRLQISADEQERITFVHPSVSNDLAERLGVPSLVNRSAPAYALALVWRRALAVASECFSSGAICCPLFASFKLAFSYTLTVRRASRRHSAVD